MINCHHCQQKDEDIRKMNETKEIILSANQTLTDHIKKQDQEIENLKYKNTYLAECALEDQKRLQEKSEWLKIENELNDKIIKNLKNALSRMLELKVYPTVMNGSYDEWQQFENECKTLVSG